MGFLLSFLLALAAPGPSRAAGLQAPRGLTLSVQSGLWTLVWNPIFDDDLEGYTVWERREKKGDFVQVTKMPLAHAIFRFKGFDQRRPAEFVVLARYLEGSSDPSRPVFTRLARRPGGEEAAPVSTGKAPGAESGSAVEAAAPSPTPAPTPFDQAPLRDLTSSITPFHQWRTRLGVGFSLQRVVSQGYDTIQNMPWIPSDYSSYNLNVKHTWQEFDMRTTVRVPLEVSYGVLPGLEAGVLVAFDSEFAKLEQGVLDGKDYGDTISTPLTVPSYNTSGLGDTHLFVASQLFKGTPFVLGLDLSLPTGTSRFKSFVDAEFSGGDQAGNGQGVPRLQASFLWGPKGLRRGLYAQGSFSPGATENVTVDLAGLSLRNQAVYGDVVTLGGGYTLPWSATGAAMLGATARHIQAGQWSINGVNFGPYLDRQVSQGLVENYGGLNLYDENELEFYLEVRQRLNGWLGTEGKLYFQNNSDGYTLGIGGGFAY